MAGDEAKMRYSIQRRLSVALSLAILLTAAVSCALTFWLALDEAHELQDDTLSQIAHVVSYAPMDDGTLNRTARRMEDNNDVSIYIDYLSPSGQSLPGSTIRFQLPVSVKDGFQDISVRGQGYRILIHSLSPDRRVVIGQRTEVRNEIAFDSAVRTLIPLALLLPLLLLLASTLTRRYFAPLHRLAGEVSRRSEHDLAPFNDEVIPQEMMPFVDEINTLLQRIDGAVQAQKRFIADAAHELRTPVTALSLQAERLGDAPMSPEAHSRLDTLRQGLKRTKVLLEQLLSLARTQQNPTPQEWTTFLLSDLLREVMESLWPLAAEKNIDIGVAELPLPERQMVTDKNALRMALKNLLENAIRYIPEAGQVDIRVRLTTEATLVEVEDNGPGIDEAQSEQLFEPFWRPEGTQPPGSGLGLSIVKACVKRMGGTVALCPVKHFPSGLRVRICLPITQA